MKVKAFQKFAFASSLPSQIFIGAFCLITSTSILAYMPLNREIKCDTFQISYFVNGKQTANSRPTDEKPIYYRFDGKQLSAYYKFANAPVASANGAKFSSQETKQNAGRTFDETEFIKLGSDNLVVKSKFSKEIGGNTDTILLQQVYSQNNFSSFGRNIYSCTLIK